MFKILNATLGCPKYVKLINYSASSFILLFNFSVACRTIYKFHKTGRNTLCASAHIDRNVLCEQVMLKNASRDCREFKNSRDF